MHSLNRKIIVVAMVGGLSACASIVGGRYQPVTVDTRSANQDIVGAECTLSNDRGQFHVTTPGTVTVHRASGPLDIRCRKDGADIAEQSFPSSIRPMVWGNLLIGGLVGIIIDFSDGAAHHYPRTVTVTSAGTGNPLAASATPYQAAPSYQAPLPAGQPNGLASMDGRIGKSMFDAAQNVAAREQCDRAIHVVMVDGPHALLKTSCSATTSIEIECQQDRCSALHASTM